MRQGDAHHFDTIVQSAMVALFHSMGIALAPIPPSKRRVAPGELAPPVGAIQFWVPRGGGTFLLSVPPGAFSKDVAGEDRVGDCIQESLNQFMGRMKNRLTQFQVTATCGLPFILTPSELARRLSQADAHSVYAFRSLRGDVLLVLDGSVDSSALIYSCQIEVRREGEVILFGGNGAAEESGEAGPRAPQRASRRQP